MPRGYGLTIDLFSAFGSSFDHVLFCPSACCTTQRIRHKHARCNTSQFFVIFLLFITPTFSFLIKFHPKHRHLIKLSVSHRSFQSSNQLHLVCTCHAPPTYASHQCITASARRAHGANTVATISALNDRT
ncbi:hypothetical protein BDN70DRAFT_349592 [Pholiota conissans]|uniref:Uncharacterized protein n=1 Tax=Pholiota conissans TaxID=109636 RepID=A0A9P5YR50_9AGAR|nr:hypothetical protein BDN70DRAFT_349592 [Pholiota conissans]